MQLGIKIQGEEADMIQFAYDIALLAKNKEDLKNILMIMNIIFMDEYNMKINESKTKILVYSRNEAVKSDIKLDGNTLEGVNECKYLGSMIKKYGGCAQEIR